MALVTSAAAATALLLVTCMAFALELSSSSSQQNPKVIIIGAGMSGLSAGKTLSDAGIKDILILEATNRIGGRTLKANFTGVSVELGANVVEGVGYTENVNPIWTIANKINLRSFLCDFTNFSANTYKQEGGRYNLSEAQEVFDMANKMNAFSANVSEYLKEHKQKDTSILTAQRLMNHAPSTPLEMAADVSIYDFEYAKPPRVTSLMASIPRASFVNFGPDTYFVSDPRGYEAVTLDVGKQFLNTNKAGIISDSRVKLNKVVREISYSPCGVVVKTEDGSIYRADYVLVTVSLGVLQSKLIDFQPDLPMWKIIALYRLEMAIYMKIFLKFPYKFWPTGKGTEFFLYATEKRGYYTLWQHLENEYPGENILLVTVTDEESRRIEQQSDSTTKKEIMEVLRNMFGKNVPEAIDILVPRWMSNRFYKGTYSVPAIGVDKKVYDQLRAPVGRIYFTGEHTNELYIALLQGAYLAGIESANMMIGCIKKGMCSS